MRRADTIVVLISAVRGGAPLAATSTTRLPAMTTETRSTHPLQTTARWTAAVRAGERERPDRLVDDPWALDLAGPEGMAWLAGRPDGSVLPIVIRTRYFDDWLHAVAIEGSMRQVILLGAGLDTRAWRLPWPAGVVVYELDRAEVLESKAGILADAGAVPACDRRPVAADLASDWGAVLRGAGFDPAVPATLLAEGVLFYLPNGVIHRVLEIVSSLAAPGSRLGFDIVNSAVLASPYTKAWIDMQAAAGAPWIGAMDDPVATLADLGWPASLVQPGEPAANHGRWTLPVPPASMPDLPHSWYVTAERQ
jgi:methyltransferase (TIGR00027 family)